MVPELYYFNANVLNMRLTNGPYNGPRGPSIFCWKAVKVFCQSRFGLVGWTVNHKDLVNKLEVLTTKLIVIQPWNSIALNCFSWILQFHYKIFDLSQANRNNHFQTLLVSVEDFPLLLDIIYPENRRINDWWTISDGYFWWFTSNGLSKYRKTAAPIDK